MRVPKVLKSVKYLLAGVNGIFLLTGIFLLLLGIAVLVQYATYESLITQRFFTLPGFVVATGVIICLVSVLGFYSSISELFYFILAYVISMLVVLVFEVSIVIASFKLHNEASSEIRSAMSQSLQLYESRIEVARVWDDMQMAFECCGVAGRSDWGTDRIPISCCHIDYGTISPFTCSAANAYSVGCAAALGEWLSSQAYVLAIGSLVVVCIQVILTAISGWLTWRSKFDEVELES